MYNVSMRLSNGFKMFLILATLLTVTYYLASHRDIIDADACELERSYEIYLAKGETYDLQRDDLTSEDETIAVCEEGKIIGISSGETTIKAACDTYTVKVSDLYTAPGIDMNKEYLPEERYTIEENRYLDDVLAYLIDQAGYQSRAGAVEAARFLTLRFPYKLHYFYERGVRMMTLTWNFENELAYPNYVYENKPDTVRGLTEKGFKVIEEMWKLGMIVDIAHLNDAGIYDVFSVAKKPIVASHSNARSVCGHVRNLTDDMILKLRENCGIMGINYCPDFISVNTDTDQIADIVKHINHIVSLAGVETVALGSDFDGIPTPKGLSDASKLPVLYEALRKEGYSEEDLDKMFYQNFLRVLKANQNH